MDLRAAEAAGESRSWRPAWRWTSYSRISPALKRAVVVAEDAAFWEHEGVDFAELRVSFEDGLRQGTVPRGASTITQQLVKNLFLTTHRSPIRKVVEFTLAPLAELILPKERILEIYLNVIEWGPGIYGVDQAARYHYGAPPAGLSREQSARLAACIPAPRTRKPARMNQYAAVILDRMERRGW
jgi:monofunctional biosynthetic peptidoglycan transglycosylase